jgi:hypothetical protein
MLMVSSMISWTLLWTGTSLFSARVTSHLDAASLALTPLFVPGPLANDMDRSSPMKVCTGSALAASFVVPTVWWVQATVAGEPVSIMWKLASLISAAVLFGPSLQTYLRARAAQQAQADTPSPLMRWWQAIEVVITLTDQPQRGRLTPAAHLFEGLLRCRRRRVDPRMGDHGEKLVNARPWDGPHPSPFGTRSHGSGRRGVKG